MVTRVWEEIVNGKFPSARCKASIMQGEKSVASQHYG